MTELPTIRIRIDIVEREGGLELLADIPGTTEDAIDLTLEAGVLTIEAPLESLTEDGFELAHGELETGRYWRRLALGDAFDAGGAEAELADGVLRLFIPRSEAAQPRRIDLTRN